MVIFVKYEVSEKKYFKIEDILKINNYEFEFKHLETTFELERYTLDLTLEYVDSLLEEQIKVLNIPVELTTTMTEQLHADIIDLNVDVLKTGINVNFKLGVEVLMIESDIEEVKDEIKEIYQQELEEHLEQREETVENDEDVIPLKTETYESNCNFLKDLRVDYVRYKVLTLDDNSLDKISAKYNLPLTYLFSLKKECNKVIVYDKE